MTDPRSPAAERFWQEYLATVRDPAAAERWYYEAFRIGDTEDSADEGASYILVGRKTATSSLLWGYQARGKPLPQVGSLCILENGRGEPVAVVKTVELVTRPFREVDARFAYDYGEWNRSLKTWRAQCWACYTRECEALGREPALEMPLVCERFRVVFPETV